MDRSGFGLGALAGLVGMACCVSPVILVLVALYGITTLLGRLAAA